MNDDWRDRAACREVSPEMWFPEVGEPAEPAKKICARCKVRAECLDFALSHDERYGVWGGLSANERDGVRRGRRLA